ncbi:MAG: ABC transporter ATP-binding protein [Gemmiger sp.]|nr:ABC transporter ATP-binding protein [Gemmiger sp.]
MKGGGPVPAIIHTEKLRKVYAVGKERVVALNDVEINVEKGEFCCIVGQSGSGKSTLLNQLAGLEKPTRGKVFIGKHEISAMSENELAEFRQAHLGFIFQSYNLLPSMTAAENVAMPLMFKGVPKKQRLALAKKELKNMGLGARMDHLPTEMSGGQQQRVGIARAFVGNPKVIFADEPTGNLDSTTSKQVLFRVLDLSKKEGTTFVMVTHEPSLAACADRIITILDGRVQSNVLQPDEVKEKNRTELFASLEGNMEIGGAAAKPAQAAEPAKTAQNGTAAQAGETGEKP